MANQNVSRLGGRHKKRDISVFFAELDFDEIATAGDVYQLGMLPPEVIVLSAVALPIVTNNAGTSATFDLGFAGGDELIDGGDLLTAAGTDVPSTAVPIHLPTGAIVTWKAATYGGAAATAGKVFVYIEYLEYTQCTGELTNFVA
jgi:hypothetical protein